MPLTDQQREDIRLEETLRHEIRKEFAGQKPKPTAADRLSAFGESKVGFWLMTTVLAGLATWGWSAMQRYVDREALREQAKIQHALRDLETVMKLGPMLTADKPALVGAAAQMLDTLAKRKAVDDELVKPLVGALLQSTVAAGNRPDARPEEHMQAETVLAQTADRARIADIQNPGTAVASASTPSTATQPAATPVIASSALPPRMYIQIADAADRPAVEALRPRLREAGILAPGVELIAAKAAPATLEIRYCDTKVDAGLVDRVAGVVNKAFAPAAKLNLKELAPRLCTNVRHNHFELWLPRRA
ncbi:MAG: hypothetical protein V4864_10355 [Pseudomonadota bacterium]